MAKQPSPFMRKHSRGKVRVNPPKPRRVKRRKKTAKAAAKAAASIRAVGIGHVTEIVYRREGRLYRHRFKPGTVLAGTEDDQLIIAGKSLRVRPFIED